MTWPTLPASLSALLIHEASDSLVLVQLADVHEAEVHEALVQLADVHEAEVQDALVQDAEVQEALVQLADVHEAEVQEALVHEAPSCAALVQLAASNDMAPVMRVGDDEPREAGVRVGRIDEIGRPRDVDLADADRVGRRVGRRLDGHHQGALDLIGRPVRVEREQHGCAAGGDRGRERRSGELHVARGDDVLGALGGERCARGDGADHIAAGCAELGLREAVEGVAVRGPGRREVVPRADGAVDVAGADRDHERVVARRVRDAAPERAVVPGRCHDDDAVEPEPLDRLVQGVEHERARVRRMEREVGDADVEAILVREDPVGGADHVRGHRLAGVVGDVDRDERRARSGADVAARAARGDRGDERAVAATVSGRVVGERGHG